MLNLSKIRFPIYPLPKFSSLTVDGDVAYYPSLSKKYSKLIVDDKSIEGDSIGMRRVRIKSDPFRKLYNLDDPIFHYVDLLRNDNNTIHFIDTNGKIFKYVKKRYYPVRYRPIVKYYELKNGGYSVKVLNIPCLFKVNKLPSLEIKYAGILFIGKALVLYDLSSEELEQKLVKI